MAQIIKPLPQIIVNRIAAGEVVERPASVVKELMENAIDAQATQITVSVIEAGKAMIAVKDDGVGISKEDLPIAIEPHTTSKLSGEYNLWNIDTFGFRGEALASISNVSNITIISKTQEANYGYKMSARCSDVTDISPCAAQRGTIVEIKDLFSPVPARMKFMKSDRTELWHISNIFQTIALCNHRISFRLISNGEPLNEYPTCGSIKERFLQIIGFEYEESIITVNEIFDKYIVSGVTSIPTFNKSSSASIKSFVNSRAIRDNYINRAVREAYSDLIPEKAYPVCAVFLSIPKKEVDINVHPAKAEVKFINSFAISEAVTKTFRANIEKYANRSALSFGTVFTGLGAALHPPSATKILDVGSTTGSYMNNAPKSNVDVSCDELRENPAVYTVSATSDSTTQTIDHDIDLGIPLAQFAKRYIISYSGVNLFIIDQHAAHERIVYEELKASFFKNQIKAQMLLSPEIIEINGVDISALLHEHGYLREMGFVIDSIENEFMIIRAVPEVLKDCDIKLIIGSVVEDIKHYSKSTLLEDRIKRVLATFACHISIRSGRILKLEEMNALLRSIEKIGNGAQCNHGRPSYFKVSLKELDRMFERS